MKILYTILFFFSTLSCIAQIQNGSFENNGQSTLAEWHSICPVSESVNEAAPNAGEWSVGLQPANTQGCFVPHFYQKLPAIQNGNIVRVSAMIKSINGNPGYLSFGKINNGEITTFEDFVSSDSTSWQEVNIEETYVLEANDTAIVILSAGIVGGPAPSILTALFDQVTIDVLVNQISLSSSDLLIYPNPVLNGELFVANKGNDKIESIQILNVLGSLVQTCSVTPNNDIITIDLEGLPVGIYLVHIETTSKTITRKIIKER